MIQANKLDLSFGNQKVFDDITFTINDYDRVGLVGRNGSGKSTLLKAITQPSILDSGTITRSKNKKIAYIPQEVVLNSSLSVIDETYTTFTELMSLQKEAAELETKLEKASGDQKIIERYTIVQDQLSKHSPDILRANAKKMLLGLGFSMNQIDQPVNNLSFGWKMRIVLAKLLLLKADFYLFDEPTNHLDLIAKEWFLSFLKESDFGFIIVCHEKYFLDELCHTILELEQAKAFWYTGNYADYIIQKEHSSKLIESAHTQQQKEIQKKQATIERFRASASKAKMVQSMIKALEKVEIIKLPPSIKNIKFNFPNIQQSGRHVLKVKNVAHKFQNKTIFSNVSFEIERGQKVALIAPNGVGKTTLFNLITNVLPLQQGSITFGHNVEYAIFAQDQNKALNLNLSVLENIKNLCPKMTEQTIRTFLGSFLFNSEDVQKKVEVLSGGEKNRVGMVNVLLQNANFLLLDEPSNHLDIPSKEILLKALLEFAGTILFVSHDRDFINILATDVIELTPQGTFNYHGNYDSFLMQKKHIQDDTNIILEKVKIPKNETKKTENNFEKVKKIKKIEDKIAKLEQRIKEMEFSFEKLEYGTKEFDQANEELQNLKKEMKENERIWEQLNNEIE